MNDSDNYRAFQKINFKVIEIGSVEKILLFSVREISENPKIPQKCHKYSNQKTFSMIVGTNFPVVSGVVKNL